MPIITCYLPVLYHSSDHSRAATLRRLVDNEPVALTRIQKLHRLEMSLKNPPKDANRGFCFGSNAILCDIVLAPRENGISYVHFTLAF